MLSLPSAVADEDSSANTVARHMRVLPELRRSCLYCVIGGWLVLTAAALLRPANAPPIEPAAFVFGLLVFALAPPLLAVSAYTYQLVLDERGLSRCRLGWWSRWPWEDVIAGQITMNRELGCLVNRARPWWDRWLMPGFLPAADINFLTMALEQVSPTPLIVTKPLIAEGVKISELALTFLLGGKLQVNAAGVELQRSFLRRVSQSFRWDEISAFRLERHANQKAKAMLLSVTLKNGRIIKGDLSRVKCSQFQLGTATSDDLWVEHLESLIPPGLWKYLRMRGELRGREEGEFRLQHYQRHLKIVSWLQWLAWGLLPVTATFLGPKFFNICNDPFLAIGWKVAAAGCGVLTCLGHPVMIYSIMRDSRVILQKWIAQTQTEMERFPVSTENGRPAQLR